MRNKYKWYELNAKGYVRDLIERTHATHTYKVTKPEREIWPEDNELAWFCDGGPFANFGGRIEIIDHVAYIDIYVD